MHNFKQLQIWQDAMAVVKDVYILTDKIPNAEKYGLISQMQRAAVSIPSNIAEGSGKESDIDFNRFLSISLGSAFELETQIILATNLRYIEEPTNILEHLSILQKKIYKFKQRISENQKS